MKVSFLEKFKIELDENFNIYLEINYALVDRCTG